MQRNLSGLFLRLNFTAKLIKEIENERNFIWRVLGGSRRLQHRKALAIGVQRKIDSAKSFRELPWRPQLSLIRAEGAGGDSVGNNHNSVVRRAVEKFLAIGRPCRVAAATRGNLPFAAQVGKRTNVDFEIAARIGLVR